MKEEILLISHGPSIRNMSFPCRKNLTWAPNASAGPVRGLAPRAPSLPRNLRYQAWKAAASHLPACDLSLFWHVSHSAGVINPWARMRNSTHGLLLFYSGSLPPREHLSYPTGFHGITSRGSAIYIVWSPGIRHESATSGMTLNSGELRPVQQASLYPMLD